MEPMRLRRCSATVLGLLLLAPALAACGGEGGVAVGDVVPAREDAQFTGEGVETVVALPVGRLEVTTGQPVTQVSAKDTRQLEKLEAPEGSTFVPITWRYDAATFGALAAYLDTDTSPVIDLVADGASYRLPAPEASGEGAESFYVLVSGKGAQPRLDVDFDGVTQQADLSSGEVDAGRAKPLYDLAKPKTKQFPCEPAVSYSRATRRTPKFSCSTSRPFRLPYAGSAWADEGKSWLVVSVRTSLGLWNEVADDLKSGAIYYGEAVDGTFRLGDTEATAVVKDPENTSCPDRTDQGTCTVQFNVVFEAGKTYPRKLTVDEQYGLRLAQVWGGGQGEDTLDLGLTATAKLT